MLQLLYVASVSSLSAWTRPLALANHPLVLFFGTGRLPRGSFERCLLARSAILEGLEASAKADQAKAALSDDSNWEAATSSLLELLAEEREACLRKHDEWREAADAAGQTIDLPQSEIDAGVRCYVCGGIHYNVDCPEELAVSSNVQALVGYLRGASSLAGASTVLRDLSFAATTLSRAGLDGGKPFRAVLAAQSDALPALAAACDRAYEASSSRTSSSGGDSTARASEEASTSRSLLFAAVDSESATSGLQAAAAPKEEIFVQNSLTTYPLVRIS